MVAVLVILASACNTLPKPQNTVMGNAGSAEGQWRGKALIKNLSSGKTGALDLEIVAQEPDRLRIEALGPFSLHVASVAVRGDEVRISMTREKKFLIVPSDRHALSRLVPVRAAPSDLMAILFDRPLEAGNSGWKCDHSSAATWTCQSGTSTVTRKPNEDGRRLFQFASPEAQMDLIVTEAHAATPPGESAYQLNPPDGFKVEQRH